MAVSLKPLRASGRVDMEVRQETRLERGPGAAQLAH